MSTNDVITVHGASEHNLNNIDVEIPRGVLTVVTGLSGSGKSSLAFNTIYAEGQRRYMESLSAYARNFLEQMNKPDVERIEGLSPSISIDQKSASSNPRSTVGTVTEIHDHLRLLFARVGTQYSPETGRRVESMTPEQMADIVMSLPEETKIKILAPLEPDDFAATIDELKDRGFTRVITDKEYDITLEDPELADSFDLVIDRVTVDPKTRSRIVEAIENALNESEDTVRIEVVEDIDEDAPASQYAVEEDDRTIIALSEGFSEPGNPRKFQELETRNFSFNSPLGACDECEGLGKAEVVAEDLVVPDPDQPVKHAVAPWNYKKDYYRRTINAFCDYAGIDPETPYNEVPEDMQDQLLYGTPGPLRYEVQKMRGHGTHMKTFEGVVEQLNRRFQQTSSDRVRENIRQYMREHVCPSCDGARLSEQSRHVKVAGYTLQEINAKNIGDAQTVFEELEDALSERDREIAHEVIKEIYERLGFLTSVGLDYLTLDREASTLSGGEAQRIRLATQIGSGLVGVLYVLDEPSIGLHRHDNHKLIDTLEGLRDLGNTLIVVEHDEQTIRRADNILDMGPGPGIHGGDVVAQGSVEDIGAAEDSITGDYLMGRKKIEVPNTRREPTSFITVKGAAEHNLREIDVDIPLGCFTAITGLSGSGKSTLMHDILYNALTRELNDNRTVQIGEHDDISGLENIESVRLIDQSPIGRTPRSNPATYTGVFDYVRELFAQTKLSQQRGYDKGRFSFNVKGGRCEECGGQGTVQIEMNFLSDVYVECSACNGNRYNDETLQVEYRGATISEVLNMSVDEAFEFFEHDRRIKSRLQLLKDVGLGYMKLGQPSTTLSGGEAQRVKLAEELGKTHREDVLYLLDEPTTGLHWEDERKLIEVLDRLVEEGNSVLVIEHELELVKCADHIIDLGPEGGERGGRIVATGTPEEVVQEPESYTGKHLQELLS